MNNQTKILFGIPTRHHVEICMDEMTGLQNMGFQCDCFSYAAKDGFTSVISRLLIIIKNAFNLIIKAYQFKPDIIYINSRLEVLAGIRDFITILLVNTFYFKEVRFIIKSHGSDLNVLGDKRFFINKVILPYLRNHVSTWLFLSSEEKNALNHIGYFSKSKVFVTKNIVRVNQFQKNESFRNEMAIANDAKILLFVGRVIKEKGIHEVIDAFVKIKENYKPILIIVGDGNELSVIKQKVKDYNLIDDVIITGFIPEADVVKFYSNADVLVFPTFFPEGFPMALFNSVAAGLSIVTTPTRAAVDFLSAPENCLWVKPENSESVRKALDTVLSSEAIREKMKENNKRKAVCFSQEQVSLELSEIIKRLTCKTTNKVNGYSQQYQ